MEALTIRVDNPPDELQEFKTSTLVPVDFPDGQTLAEWWKRAGRGTYLLLTKSKRQPVDLASVHVALCIDGQLQYANGYLKAPLVGVQEVFRTTN